MALVKEEEGVLSVNPVSPPTEIKSVEITDPKNVVLATDNRYIPRMNLTTHVEGAEWIIEYYSQILTTESPLSGQQMSVNPTNQQYKKINQLKVKVTSSLMSTQQEDSSMLVTGESVVSGYVIPNQGDMFVADMEGRLAVFKVTKSDKLSIFKDASYRIGYTLINTDEVTIDDLKEKTVEDTYYHEKFVSLGKNPIIASNDYSALLELEEQYRVMVDQYFRRFFSKEFKTLLLPAQSETIYDHFAVKFISKLFTTWDAQEIKDLNIFNMMDDDNMECDSIWTAIINRNVSYLNSGFKQYGLMDVWKFSNLPVSCSIRWSGISKVVYPRDPKLTVDNQIRNNEKLMSDSIVTPTPDNQMAEIIRSYNLRNIPIDPDKETMYPVTEDLYYVLSEKFYTKADDMSVLESLVWDYLEKKEIDQSQLLNTAKTFTSWGLLEQYYYVPIIMIMIRSIIGD